MKRSDLRYQELKSKIIGSYHARWTPSELSQVMQKIMKNFTASVLVVETLLEKGKFYMAGISEIKR